MDENHVRRYASDGTNEELLFSHGGPGAFSAIAVSGAGDYVYLGGVGVTLTRFPINGGGETWAPMGGVISIDVVGEHLYFVRNDERVYHYSSAVPDSFLGHWGGTAFWLEPKGIAADGQGNVYVSESYRVFVFDASGSYLRDYYPGGANCTPLPSVAVDVTGGFLYAADCHSIVMINDMNGNRLGTVGKFGEPALLPDRLDQPRAVKVGQSGLLYVLDGNSVPRISYYSISHLPVSVAMTTWGGLKNRYTDKEN